MKVLIDLNVLLDTLQKREPFYRDSAHVLALVESGRLSAVVAAHSITTLFYLLTRALSADEARIVIADLLRLVDVAAVDGVAIRQALSWPYRDFEDAVQMAAAVAAGAEYVVTRNKTDFAPGPLPAVQPAVLLAVLAQ